MGRPLVAILIGFVVASAIAVGADAAIRSLFPSALPSNGYPEAAWLSIVLVYVAIAAVVGGIVAAHLTPGRETQTGLELGGLMLVTGLAGAVARPHTAPLWYHVISLALVLPVTVAGARWRARLRTHPRAVRDG